MPESADMKIWRDEFNQMSLEEHDKILKNLGLDEEDIEEFNDTVKGKRKIEDTLGVSGDGEVPAKQNNGNAARNAKK